MATFIDACVFGSVSKLRIGQESHVIGVCVGKRDPGTMIDPPSFTAVAVAQKKFIVTACWNLSKGQPGKLFSAVVQIRKPHRCLIDYDDER